MRTGRSLTVCRSLLRGGGVSAPRGVCSRGVSAPGGVSALEGGVCSRGVSAPGGVYSGGWCLLWGVSAPRGGVCSWRGCLLQGGVCSRGVASQHALRQTPPLVARITDACKNITLATTSLRPVIKQKKRKRQKYIRDVSLSVSEWCASSSPAHAD